MNKLAIVFIAGVVALGASPVFGQKFFGCAEKNYRCQLDGAMKALEANPKDPDGYYHLAMVWQRSGNHQQAIETYTMYILIPGVKPKDLADGYNNRGVSYRRVGQPGPALLDFVKATQLVPGNPAFVTNQGNARTDLKQYDAALGDYAAALKLDPRYGPAYTGRAHLYNATSRYDEAIADFSKAIEYDPGEPENYYNRGVVYRKKVSMRSRSRTTTSTFRWSPATMRYWPTRTSIAAITTTSARGNTTPRSRTSIRR